MRTVKGLIFVCILCFPFLAATPATDNSDVNQVIQAALQPSPIQNNLHRLTDEIGGRVPGTLGMQHAIQWGLQALTAAGADNVHTEGFETAVLLVGRRDRDDGNHRVRGQPDESRRRNGSILISHPRRVGGLGSGARSGQTRSDR